jgi:hypothetical protein
MNTKKCTQHLTKKVAVLVLASFAVISANAQTTIRIEAESYTDFSDTTPQNLGGQLHDDGVDIERTSDLDEGHNVGWIESSEQLEYQFNIQPGEYTLSSRVASAVGGGNYSVSLDGVLINFDNVIDTTDWQIFSTNILGNISVDAGTHKLLVEVNTGGFNLNWLELTPTSTSIKIEAEDFDRAQDSDSVNHGGAYRLNDEVDIETTNDEGPGHNVGWTESGEYLEYNFNSSAGIYALSARVASNIDTAHYALFIDEDLIKEQRLDKTQGWQSFETHDIGTKTLNSGQHSLRVEIYSGGVNLNWFLLSPSDTAQDSDNDGVINSLDLCPNTPPATTVDADGCEIVSNPPFTLIEAESFSGMSGIQDDATTVGYFDAGDWIKYSAVNFASPAKSITLTVAGEQSGGSAELRLGSPTGTLIGSYTMTSTSGWGDYQARRFNINHTSGVHDLYIVGKNGTGIFNIDSLQLSPDEVDIVAPGNSIKAMSLNVYGWATMPQSAGAYADLIQSRDVDVVGIQEGVEDWLIGPVFPTDYSKANALGAALGQCWEQRYQIFINTCKGNSFVSNKRFDLTDGPNATRTGESAIINKNGFQYAALTIHWDHQSATTRFANARETADEVNSFGAIPTVVVGDFNTGCSAAEVNTLVQDAGMQLIGNTGIDCIIAKGFTGTGQSFDASPSDHPGLEANLDSI